MKSSRKLLILIVYALLQSSCVSVNISPTKISKSEGVTYTAPQNPFESFVTKHVDAAWKNPKNGNSISFLSECNPSVDSDLKTITRSTLTDFSQAEVHSEEEMNYNGRKALQSIVQGEVDGISSKFNLIVFKKNDCIYILSYAALAKSYSSDLESFNQFTSRFRAP